MNQLWNKRRILGLMSFIFICLMFLTKVDVQNYTKTSLYPLFRTIEKYRMLYSVKDFKQVETQHFIIIYDKTQREIVDMTAEIAEKYYADLCEMYQYTPKEKTQIIIYDDGKLLNQQVRIKKSEAPLGVYYGDVLHVLNPTLWVKDGDLKENYEVNGPIVHEFTHLIIDHKTSGNYPMWLTEGLALYTEYKTTGFEWGKNLVYNESIKLEDLDRDFDAIDQNLAYKRSFEIVRDVSESWGFDKVVEVLNHLGHGKNMESTTRAVLKVNLYDMD